MQPRETTEVPCSTTAMNAPDATTPRLIVGMARAATTWLCKCLNEHSEVVAFGESLFWGRRFVAPGPDGRYEPEQVESIRLQLRGGGCLESVLGDGAGCLRHLDQASFAEALDEAFLALPARPTPTEVFMCLLRTVAVAEGRPVAVEKTPHHLNWIDRIFKAMPDARLVVMLREPYGFMLSYKHQGDRLEPRVRREFRRRYHPFGCAIVWRGAMRAALAAQQQSPRQVLIVEYSDLEENTDRVLRDVQLFLGVTPIDLHRSVPADNSSFPGRTRPELGAEDVFWMNLVAGATMARAGVERRPVPRRPWPILVSILRFPFWAIWNLFSLRRNVSGSVLRYLWRWLRPPVVKPGDLRHRETHG